MQRDHIVDGFWQMPCKPVGDWPGTKNGRDHRVALSEPALALIEGHLAAKNSCNRAGLLLKKLVAELGIERVTPHDLRRTCLTTITRLGFGRDAMDRIANHKTRAVTDVYDRHGYADEDKQIMAAVARQVLSLVEESGPTNVVALRYRRDRACPWSFPYIRETDPPAGTPGSPVQKGQTASRSRRRVSDEGRRRGDEGDRSTIKLSVHGGSRNPQSTASQQRVQPARVLRSM